VNDLRRCRHKSYRERHTVHIRVYLVDRYKKYAYYLELLKRSTK